MTFKFSMMKAVFIVMVIFLTGCNQVKEKVKEGAHKAGEAGGEVIKQVSQGVSNAFDIHITLSDSLRSKGLQSGNATLGSDSAGTDNVLGLYFIFTENFSNEVSVKVYNKNMVEKGRLKLTIQGKKEDARYIDLHFDRHVNLDADDKVIIE